MNTLRLILKLIWEGIVGSKPATPGHTPIVPAHPTEEDTDYTDPEPVPVPPINSRPVEFDAAKSKVYNRGSAPDSFLKELVLWAKVADREIFAATYGGTEADIYETLREKRPEFSLLDRRAVLCEVLRVLGGFESSWNWNEGRDVTNSTSNRPETEEAGIFQVSGNSMYFSPTLVECFVRFGGGGRQDYDTFRRLTKVDHRFAIEYTARLLRFTIRHHGPVKRGEIFPWMSAESIAEFSAALGYESIQTPQEPAEKPESDAEPEWLVLAREQIGVKEIKGSRHHPEILEYWEDSELSFKDDETPWCAGFVGAMLERAGIDGTASGMARSYERWGVKLDRPTLGCVVTFYRGSRSSGSGHVGFFVGFDKSGNIMVLGGNQSDAVNITPFSQSRLTGYWWPNIVPVPKERKAPLLTSDGRVSTNES